MQAAKRASATALQRQAEYAERKRLVEQLRNERAAADGIAAPETYLPTVIPHFDGHLTPLPDQRRQEFAASLTVMIASIREKHDTRQHDESTYKVEPSQASSVNSDCASDENVRAASPSSDHPWPDVGRAGERLSSRVCATCRGFCCQQGSTHAFLSEQRLYDFWLQNPHLTLDQVKDQYLRYVPEETFENSCVYHSSSGCALPSDMRAETCSRYYCRGQQDLRASMELGGARRAFVAFVDGQCLVESHFLNEEASSTSEL